MNVVIHDLTAEQWDEIKDQYAGYRVVSDDNTLIPCVGCFKCWVKDPGRCVLQDGHQDFGAMLSKADQLVIISKYTYGGFSAFVKNVLDRSIGYIHPDLVPFGKETHHRPRYNNQISLILHLYGEEISVEEQKMIKQYADAVCTNLHGRVKTIDYTVIDEPHEAAILSSEENAAAACDTTNTATCDTSNTATCNETNNTSKPEEFFNLDGIALINCSMKGDRANSKKYLDTLEGQLSRKAERINLGPYLNRMDELFTILKSKKTIVLSMPLYVDGLPSQAIRLMEMLEKMDFNGNKRVFVISNMGFYESCQINNLLRMVKNWCRKIGYVYCGGLAIGAGPMQNPIMSMFPLGKGPAKRAGKGLIRMADAIEEMTEFEDIYADTVLVPRVAYNTIANRGWVKAVKRNGMKKADLSRRL